MSLPVPKHPITLIARKDYRVTARRVVSLCVVQTHAGKELRLYRWRRKHENEQWKVGLANFAIQDINVDEMSRDARNLAREHGIQLGWDISREVDPPAHEDVPDLEDTGIDGESDPVAESRPLCPACGVFGETVPIVYGFAQLQTAQDSGADYELGDWSYSVESPLWYCRSCGGKWGRVAWSESLPPQRILQAPRR